MADLLRSRLAAAGLDVGASASPIVPVVLGDAARVVAASFALRNRGIFAPSIRPPTVPAGSARLRVSVTAAHSREDVESLAHGLIDTAFLDLSGA